MQARFQRIDRGDATRHEHLPKRGHLVLKLAQGEIVPPKLPRNDVHIDGLQELIHRLEKGLTTPSLNICDRSSGRPQARRDFR